MSHNRDDAKPSPEPDQPTPPAEDDIWGNLRQRGLDILQRIRRDEAMARESSGLEAVAGPSDDLFDDLTPTDGADPTMLASLAPPGDHPPIPQPGALADQPIGAPVSQRVDQYPPTLPPISQPVDQDESPDIPPIPQPTEREAAGDGEVPETGDPETDLSGADLPGTDDPETDLPDTDAPDRTEAATDYSPILAALLGETRTPPRPPTPAMPQPVSFSPETDSAGFADETDAVGFDDDADPVDLEDDTDAVELEDDTDAVGFDDDAEPSGAAMVEDWVAVAPGTDATDDSVTDDSDAAFLGTNNTGTDEIGAEDPDAAFFGTYNTGTGDTGTEGPGTATIDAEVWDDDADTAASPDDTSVALAGIAADREPGDLVEAPAEPADQVDAQPESEPDDLEYDIATDAESALEPEPGSSDDLAEAEPEPEPDEDLAEAESGPDDGLAAAEPNDGLAEPEPTEALDQLLAEMHRFAEALSSGDLLVSPTAEADLGLSEALATLATADESEPTEPDEPTETDEPESITPAEAAEPDEPTVPIEPVMAFDDAAPTEPIIPFDDSVPTEPIIPIDDSVPTEPVEPGDQPSREAEPDDDPPLPDNRYLDRELSWLAFNNRVLDLARDHQRVPLLERARFLAIFSSNLDEFFMVRVAGLKRRIDAGMAQRGTSGLLPRELHDAILSTARDLMAEQSRVFVEEVQPELAEQGLLIVHWSELTPAEQTRLGRLFAERVFPILTPLAVDPSHPFPYISGLSLNLGVQLRNPATGGRLFARIKVPNVLPRFIEVSEGRYVPLEDIIAAHLPHIFTGMDVIAWTTFRITRNEDVEVEEDDAESILFALERELLHRRVGRLPVRLEVEAGIDPELLETLTTELDVTTSEVFFLTGPLDLTGLFSIADADREDLTYPGFTARTNPALAEVETSRPADLFTALKKRDVLLHHPYDSFATSVLRFIEQAASDPQVLAIKQTLYRTSGDSPVVDALIEAAQAGKQVLALVEIKARFDEVANIAWARKLEQAGVHVVYGLVGLKTHCKLSLVIRDEGDSLRRYCHIGTGNYNPKTARSYEDMGLLTADPVITEDVARLFNHLSGMTAESNYQRLLVSPFGIRDGLIERIDQEIALQRSGIPGRIRFKVNSIVDEAMMDALYRASRAGVKVDLWVRGICALRAGVPGLSDNIRVRSILGRFLEHSRLFWFDNAGDPVVGIGSADLMHRNLDRRVETVVQLGAEAHIAQIDALFNLAFDDTTASWWLTEDGWVQQTADAGGKPLRDLQDYLLQTTAIRRPATAVAATEPAPGPV